VAEISGVFLAGHLSSIASATATHNHNGPTAALRIVAEVGPYSLASAAGRRDTRL
jgi:hypothetical protein